MPEHRGAQVVHHPLADLIREQRLDDPEGADHDRDRDHAAGVERERGRVVLTDRLQDVLEQERGDDAQRRGDDDQEEDSSEAQPVRHEEPADPLQVCAAHLRVGGALRRRVGGVKEHAHRRSEYVAGQGSGVAATALHLLKLLLVP